MLTKRRKYSLSNEQIARIFGYKNVSSFNNSSASRRIKKAIETLIIIIEEETRKKINDCLDDC